VVTKFDQACDDKANYSLYSGTCRISGIRRTIWDGSQELGEIQVPADGLENDNYVGQGTVTSTSRNLSPYYGAVAYAFDGQVDQPLAVTRLRYANYTPSNTIVQIPAFTYYPMWDIHSLADLGLTLPSAPSECAGTVKPGDKVTCVSYVSQRLWSPYRDVTHQHKAWHGTLLEDKAGTGGLMYRRNRYYDSRSGRFTQEDPIGLAGGINLYGYANADPVNFSDPFGLQAKSDTTYRKRHDRCEVAAILTDYTDALRSNPLDFTDGTYPREFDFKFSNRGEQFQVGGQWLKADQFGNFAAGYAGESAFGDVGWAAMVAGGVYYASQRNSNGQRVSGEPWTDRASRPMINTGARRAYSDAMTARGSLMMRGGVVRTGPRGTPLTSKAGCH
jgi:RHS repeat-associated protein